MTQMVTTSWMGWNWLKVSYIGMVKKNKIQDNMGVGISAAVLTGEVREADLSAFVPLAEVPIPYHTFGMVDICDPHKEIIVEERMLVYYKYDNNPGKIMII